MSDYLSLYKLELGETPYSVQRIIDTEQQASPECQLPDLTPLDLNLPALPALPELNCEFNVEVPLIPLPYVCPPNVSGGIAIKNCDGTETFGTASINRTAGTCDFVLSGDIAVCVPVPCSGGFSYTGDLTILQIGSDPGVDLSGSMVVTDLGCGADISLALTLDGSASAGVCKTGVDVELLDDTMQPQTLDLGSGVGLVINPQITLTPDKTKCMKRYTLELSFGSTSITGATWQEVKFCDEFGAEVTKKILVADA